MDGQSASEDLAPPGPPLGLLAELTHRCPLQCPYCSNPLKLLKRASELDTANWLSIFDQAAELGVLQVHLSGGEPTLRPDLEAMVERLASRGVYSNLITAGVLLSRERLFELAGRGLDHVQISLQSVHGNVSDAVGNYKGGLQKKLALARWVREAGLPLTINAPVHRHNIRDAEKLIALALELDADRLEIAHVQYYGWATVNRAALMPDYEQVIGEARIVAAARQRLKGIMTIDYVTPDYYAKYPKPCMGGWARDVMIVTPGGKVLPCHAAESLTHLSFESAAEKPLAAIWTHSDAFNRYRGMGWMREPCRGCPRRQIDFGGCRCQAFALTGDVRAADPACSLSPHHHLMQETAERLSASPAPPFQYRRIGQYPP